MKPTVKVVITGSGEVDNLQFIGALSEIEVTGQEKKIPHPFSATKEEAVLWMQTGRVEWENVVVQMQALTAYKRYDFIWPTLSQEVYGVIVLVDLQDEKNLQGAKRLLKLLNMMDHKNCLVAVKRGAADQGYGPKEMQSRLETGYTVVSYTPNDKESMDNVLRAWLKLVPPPDEPVRRRGRNSSRTKEMSQNDLRPEQKREGTD